MRIIALEEHVVTPLYVSKDIRVARTSTVADRSAKLGHDIRAELLDIGDSRLKYMDAAGIDVQVLSLTMPGAQVNGHTGGEFLDDKKYWAIFEAAHGTGPLAAPVRRRRGDRIPMASSRPAPARAGSSRTRMPDN